MKTDILHAATNGGQVLPVIDITHPAFTVTTSDAELAWLCEQFVRESPQRQEMLPALREALKNSMLGRGLMAASGSVLSGLSTYLLKLGPDNLGPEAQPIDRSIAASFPALTVRIRLQDMARVLADGLASRVGLSRGQPLLFINIAGGPAADSWNALIALRREHRHLLADRRIVIAVLDIDEAGPEFGSRAIAVLSARGGRLEALDIDARNFRYDWAQTGRLQPVLEGLNAVRTICAISSEGGLFEYGSDAEIAMNLEALHAGTAPDAIVVGSVTREGQLIRCLQTTGGVASRPRTREAFSHLVQRSGWRLDRVFERPFSYHVLLIKN